MNKISYMIILSLSILPTCLQASEGSSYREILLAMQNAKKIKTNAIVKALRLNAINDNPVLYTNKNYHEIEIIVGQKISAMELLSNCPPESELDRICKHLDFTPKGMKGNYVKAFRPIDPKKGI